MEPASLLQCSLGLYGFVKWVHSVYVCGKKLLESVSTGVIADIALIYRFFLTTDIIKNWIIG